MDNWGYNNHIITPINGVITLLTTGKGPPCMELFFGFLVFIDLSKVGHLLKGCHITTRIRICSLVRGGILVGHFEICTAPVLKKKWKG